MKITCDQDHLKRGLSIVGRAVAVRSTLPVLGHVLLVGTGGTLNLTATNGEWGIACRIAATIEEEGAITVPARLLGDVVGNLPNDRVDLTLNVRTQTLTLTCARFAINIKGIDAEEFPTLLPPDVPTSVVEFPSSVLYDAITQVAFAATTEENRPVLQGVNLDLSGKRGIFSATNGYRLAQYRIDLPEEVPTTQNLIIPARTLSELSRIVAKEDNPVAMVIHPSSGYVLFRTTNVDLVARLIDGTFPHIDQFIPRQYQTRAVVDRQDLMQAVKLASFFAVASSGIVRLRFEPGNAVESGRITISANADEVGDNTGYVDATIQGEGGAIALNVRFLVDAITAIPTSHLALEIQSAEDPAIFKPVDHDHNDHDDTLHLIMPMMMR